jgi:alpha-galactosidase
MIIEYFDEAHTFFLHAGPSTYAMKILEGHLVHLYWGNRLAMQSLDASLVSCDRPFSPINGNSGAGISLDTLRLEYPVYGTSDFRSPAIEILQDADGSRILDLRYESHAITPGKPALPGLPATYVENDDEAETLTITLRDAKLGLRVELLYTVFAGHPILCRSTRIVNDGRMEVTITRALSTSVDFPSRGKPFHYLHLSGAWARERDVECLPLHRGIQSIESRRGASSHHHNPFFALSELGDNERHGEVFGFSLVYSGNFLGQVELDSHGIARAQLGINPFHFSWKLRPGGSFQTPEVVQIYSSEGLGSLSRSYHRLYRTRLCRGAWRDRERPVVFNNWEATYFDFDAARLERLADAATRIGVDLFVLDDGWFGVRDNDRTSLGDWFVDARKLPQGLAALGRNLETKGLKFGLWFEPEMVSPDSDLYREHPDWCLHVPERPRSEARNQLVLDFSRKEVVEEIYQRISRILREAPVSYVKWDMNRPLTEVGSNGRPADEQLETAHRYMLGLYELMDRLTGEFPEVLFEGCSGGGGRFDPGILHYMPQIWTSDNTDAISRLKIQHGTSLVYPLSSMAAHVSVVPNHQTGRRTPMSTRLDVAFTGAFGYEMDLGAIAETELTDILENTLLYKRHRALIAQGDYYRLASPFHGNGSAWMVVDARKNEALVTCVRVLAEANPPDDFLKLEGLDGGATYQSQDGKEFRGDFLMQVGLRVPPASGDYTSSRWRLERKS